MLPFPTVISFYLPWDFILILLFLAVIVPWRGNARMKRLLSKPDLTTADRLSLYGSTIFFQWLIAGIVAWRSLARGLSPSELGLAVSDPWQVVWASIALTGLLCLNQLIGLRRIVRMPEGKRGALFAITEKIMPRNRMETFVYAALSCTAGISEEFLYRGFVFTAFVRIIGNIASPNAGAAVLSSVWFALAHLYQGRRGLITTLVVGIIFVSVRIWTGSLVPVMVAHFGIDLVIGVCTFRFLRRT